MLAYCLDVSATLATNGMGGSATINPRASSLVIVRRVDEMTPRLAEWVADDPTHRPGAMLRVWDGDSMEPYLTYTLTGMTVQAIEIRLVDGVLLERVVLQWATMSERYGKETAVQWAAPAGFGPIDSAAPACLDRREGLGLSSSDLRGTATMAGVIGESQIVDGAVDSDSMCIGLSHTTATSGTGMDFSAPTFTQFGMGKRVDNSTSFLRARTISGVKLGSVGGVVYRVTEPDGSTDRFRVTLSNPTVTTLRHRSDADRGQEWARFAYEKIQIEYTPPGSSTPIKWDWDLTRDART